MALEKTINEIERYFRDYKKIVFVVNDAWKEKLGKMVDNRCKSENKTEEEILLDIICFDIKQEYESKQITAELKFIAEFFGLAYAN